MDPTDILIGGRAHFSIVVNVPKGETVSFPMYKNNEEMIPGLEVLSVKRDTMINGNRMKVREIYTLTGWDEKKVLNTCTKSSCWREYSLYTSFCS